MGQKKSTNSLRFESIKSKTLFPLFLSMYMFPFLSQLTEGQSSSTNLDQADRSSTLETHPLSDKSLGR